MRWMLKYTKQAVKFLEKTPNMSAETLDSSIQKALKKVILREHTNINIQKMKGEWKDFYRIREGDLRIILKFDDQEHSVLIHRIGWRGDVYK